MIDEALHALGCRVARKMTAAAPAAPLPPLGSLLHGWEAHTSSRDSGSPCWGSSLPMAAAALSGEDPLWTTAGATMRTQNPLVSLPWNGATSHPPCLAAGQLASNPESDMAKHV